jgi:hypothetical protein
MVPFREHPYPKKNLSRTKGVEYHTPTTLTHLTQYKTTHKKNKQTTQKNILKRKTSKVTLTAEILT